MMPAGLRARMLLATVVAAGVVLTACGPRVDEDERDRRFAEQSRPPVATATVLSVDGNGTPVTAGPDRPPGTPAPVDPGQLLVPQGGAGVAFFVADGQLLIASAAGGVLVPDLAGTVRAISVAPLGERVAVLLDSAGPVATPVAGPGTPPVTPVTSTANGVPSPVGFGAARVVVLGASGETLRTLDDLTALQALAASEGRVGDGVATLALGPGSDDLLVALADGLLIRLPESGAPAPVQGSGNLTDIRQVSWDPDGDGIAIVAAQEPGETPALFYSALRSDGIDAVRLAPGAGRSVSGATWLPDGSGILFTDAAGPVSVETLRQGRDLFVSRLRTDRRDLVVAAGVIGPSAGVLQFAPGAEGLVAYTLVRAEGDLVRFNSLRIGRVGDGATTDILLPADVTVEGLAWTSAGLMVLTAAGGAGPTVYLIGGDGIATALGATASDASTPVADIEA